MHRSAQAPPRHPPSGGRLAGWLPAVLAVLIALLHLAALGAGPGAGYGDDFALYVLHARNLAEGRPYADTGYLVSPLNPWYSPGTYPPGFPVLLAPVYAAAGLHFRAMKAVVVLALAGTLLLLARLARREIPAAGACAVVLLAGLHPLVFVLSDNVLPDIPFTLFCLAALALAARAGGPELRPAERAAWGAAALVAVAAATATRSIGVVLLPTLAAVLLLRSRRPWRTLLACAAAAAALLAARVALFPTGSGYLRQLHDLVSVYGPLVLVPDAERLGRAGWALAALWSSGHSVAGARVLALATLLLAAAGLAPRLRAPRAHDVFFVAYLCAVFLWPAVNPRYLLPVLPLYVLYAVMGARRLARSGPAGRAGAAAVALAVAATFAGRYASPEVAGAGGAGTGAEAQALYRHLREHTPPGARFLATRPRALALFAGRAAAPLARGGTPDSIQRAFMEDEGIGYVVVRVGRDPLRGLVERNPRWFRRVYANRSYELFRALTASRGPAGSRGGAAPS